MGRRAILPRSLRGRCGRERWTGKDPLESIDQAGEKTAGRFLAVPVVGLVGAEDEVALGAGDGDVEEAFFLLQLAILLGVVAGEFVFGQTGDNDGVELEAFGLVDG